MGEEQDREGPEEGESRGGDGGEKGKTRGSRERGWIWKEG